MEALRLEGFRVLEGVGDGFGDGRGDLDAACGLVERDLEVERLEGLALGLARGVAELLAEVGDAREALGELVGFGVLLLDGDLGEGGLVGRLVGLQLGDAGGDGFRVDAGLDRLDLGLDAAVGIGDLLAQAGGGELAVTGAFAGRRAELLLQLVEAHRPEDPLLEEPQDDGEHGVLAEVDPLLAGVRVDRGGVAVAVGVGAGVVVVALAGLALHRERLVPGRAVGHTGEQVAAVALDGLSARASLREAGLGLREQLVGHERQVRVLGDDPLLLGALLRASA
ncbi:MAG TPA: hypothetical protein VKB03_08150 [Conexibacter sp.]|nr:hypothetical protein [Conexibacter sp.]